MKGFTEVTIQNCPFVIEYKGEHYVVRHRSGRTVRMAKADIIKKFHLHHDALDRYIGGGFKPIAMPMRTLFASNVQRTTLRVFLSSLRLL